MKGSPSTWFYSAKGKENHDRIFGKKPKLAGADVIIKCYYCGFLMDVGGVSDEYPLGRSHTCRNDKCYLHNIKFAIVNEGCKV